MEKMKTNEVSHTPTPWRESSDGLDIIGFDNTDVARTEMEEINKAFVLKAVNAYDSDQKKIKALVEAAKIGLSYVESEEGTGHEDSDLIKNALQQAGE